MRVEILRNDLGNRAVLKRENNQPAVRPKAGANLAFTGGIKNVSQVASLTPENQGLGLAEAKQGGEGVVGLELPASLKKHENIDARSFMPIWNYNNQKGGYKFLIHPEKDYPNWGKDGIAPAKMPAANFYSADYGETIEQVAKKLKLKTSELNYVVQSAPDGVGAKAMSQYCIIEPTTVKGSVTRLSDETLGETKSIPYELFKISSYNPEYNALKGQAHYFVYTEALAKTAKPYSYDSWGNGSFDAEIINSDEMRALTQIIHKQMNTKEFGYFNPASVICHDRPAHTYGNHIANMSAAGDTEVNGLKIHIIAHNTGRNYQGMTGDPFKMMTVVDDASVAEELKKLPDFAILQKAKRYGINNGEKLSPREQQLAWALLEPHLRPFRDGAGTYNILKAGISSAATNPENVSTGTVSITFDKEMKSQETPDAAKFLTDDYAGIQTKSVVNGSTPASLNLDIPGNFGGGELTSHNGGYTPYIYMNPEEKQKRITELPPKITELKETLINKNGENPKNFDEIKKLEDKIKDMEKALETAKKSIDINGVLAAKEKNAKWLTNLIWEAGEKGQETLDKLFFNEAQRAGGAKAIGYLSPVKDGDILIFGFGRADEQKGFPISTGGFLDFLKRKDVPQADKLKVKMLLGSSKWNEQDADYKAIVRDIKEIAELDGGIYKHNIMSVDGRISNRILACAHYGLFTSRREMCGITPLESKAAGTPYGATKTGGPVDYTNNSNGFLTKEAVELRPEKYGLSWDDAPEVIDKARVKRQSKQVSDIIKNMYEEYTNDHDTYVAKCKKNIEEKVDWHENSEYNGGKSANKRYLEDILETDKPVTERYQGPMKRIAGAFGEFREHAEDILGTTAKSRPMRAVFAIIGGVAVLTGGYMLYKNYHHKTTKKLDSVA